MKDLQLGILLSVIGLSLVACSSTPTDQPGAVSSAATPASTNAAPVEAPKPAAPKLVSVPAGTTLEVALENSLSSSKNSAGDKFQASLVSPLVVDGTTVLEKGAQFHGHVVDAQESGRVKGLASITLALTDVVQDGKTVPINTKSWSQEAQNTKKRDVGVIGGAAAIGTAIGAIAGGKKGAAEGAAIGGGAGTGTVLATKGKEVELGAEAKLKFTLAESIDLAATK